MKKCYKEYHKQYNKHYYPKNKQKRINTVINWREQNREKYNKWCLEYYHKKLKKDVTFVLNRRITVGIYLSLRKNKVGNWNKILPYTVKQLKQKLECQFTKGMSWNKVLTGKIHIDHKKPKSLFRFNSCKDQAFKDCWSLANLQLLWAVDNLKKSDKFG